MTLITENNQSIEYNPELPLYTEPVVYEGTLMGINLRHNNHLLCTCESIGEALFEMGLIVKTNDIGFRDWYIGCNHQSEVFTQAVL